MKQIIIIFVIFFSLFSVAYAQTDGTDKNTSTTVTLNNPLGTTTDVPTLIGHIINGVLGVVGSFALLMFVYGGFMWMLSAGNEQMIEKGKSTLIWAALGLVVIFMSYALVNFIITKL